MQARRTYMLDILLKLGLSDKEAKVYVAALKLGSAPAAKIAQTAELNRPTTYVILEKLAQMGLVTIFDKGKVQYFTAEDPAQLFSMAEAEKRAIDERVQELKERLPEFQALFARADRPRVLLYESPESANDYFYNRLKEGEHVYAFTDLDSLSAAGEDKAEPELRLRKRIPTRVLYTRNAGPVVNATNKDELREAKFIAREVFPFRSVISCAPESGVIFLSDKKTRTTVVIENKQLSLSLKAIFDLLWSRIS